MNLKQPNSKLLAQLYSYSCMENYLLGLAKRWQFAQVDHIRFHSLGDDGFELGFRSGLLGSSNSLLFSLGILLDSLDQLIPLQFRHA